MEGENPSKNVLEMEASQLENMIKLYIKYLSGAQATSIVEVLKVRNESLTKMEFVKKAKVVHTELHKGRPSCTYCFKSMKSKKQMIDHISGVHEGKKKKFICETCPSTFMSSKSLEYHTNTVHSETKAEVRCEVCDAVFSHQVSLIRHQKSHEEALPEIKCLICKKTFGRIDNLTRHVTSVHNFIPDVNYSKMVLDLKTNNEVYECKICKQEFCGKDASYDLETHIMRKCQQFDCKNCGKSFSSKENMKQHMKTHHTDNVRLSCTKCNFESNYKSNLTKHVKRQHPE